ncbi:HK97 family phage prohead protease [Dyadobacter sp. CY312]|uniref:HK97 family phage prohead protease n=1 Tax=Dyadobacter sp. CY312 TaxID=2907303 RepID=UPI001F1F7D94|nr:HK97 family phage prohead protease [Dyadobacter sp. CY312]MCE7038985.1 HK97 family phage prohead protease [Dyadobacter sp. CY312]
MEKTFLPQELSEVRTLQDEEGVRRIEGLAIVFDSPSRIMRTLKSVSRGVNNFQEVIDKNALDGADFSNAISCWNHNVDYILGSVRNGTATYEIDQTGMPYKTLPPDTQLIRDMVFAPIDRRDVTGSSFVFNIAPDGDYWERGSNGLVTRYVKKITVISEWGPVSRPAFLDTTTEVVSRSFDDFIATFQQEEKSYNAQLAKMRLAIGL